ncbi:hypothetical protein [Streptomyces cavernae]|uniref:hypothetical protein n=1 Tax=Streptomyces cavernae TaxID=2259034 RepID=UPI000FEB7E7F|nr:hypothetical protein [Streptomyces cavernae]
MSVRRLLPALPLLAVLLSGCGIRATEVPTDFGPAPSRVPCSLPGPDLTTQSSGGVPVQIFLVCSAQLVTVERTVTIPSGNPATDRVRVAQALVDELAETPTALEKQARYTTAVRSGMTVSSPRSGDPADALRLSTPPGNLSSYALAQLVCTLAGSAAASDDGTVTLGGPDGGALRRYECTDDVRTSPGSKPVTSTEVKG